MFNLYSTQSAKIIEKTDEAPNIKRFKFELDKKFEYEPGQIIFLSIPGFGEAPFAPCGDGNSNIIELCIRKAGKVTEKIHSLEKGESVGIRGPYGNGWLSGLKNVNNSTCHPERIRSTGGEAKDLINNDNPKDSSALPQNDKMSKNQNLLIVVGGLGLIPLRTLLSNKNKYFSPKTKIQIFYGAKTPDEFLFKNDFDEWRKQGIDIKLTIDKQCSGWNACIGVVTKLFDEYPIVANARAFLCGPPIMYKFVLEKIKEKNAGLAPEDAIKDEDIYVSLERRMHCGIGVCQHCAVGSFYTCKDGPVFRYGEIKDIPGAI